MKQLQNQKNQIYLVQGHEIEISFFEDSPYLHTFSEQSLPAAVLFFLVLYRIN